MTKKEVFDGRRNFAEVQDGETFLHIFKDGAEFPDLYCKDNIGRCWYEARISGQKGSSKKRIGKKEFNLLFTRCRFLIYDDDCPVHNNLMYKGGSL